MRFCIQAEIARLHGEIDKSSNLLHRAIKLLTKEKDKTGEAEALHSLASLARRKGDVKTALEYLEKAEKLVAEDSETYLKCANTRGLCFDRAGNLDTSRTSISLRARIRRKQVK